MGFSWSETISASGVTLVKASHFTEMKTNLESLYSSLGKNYPVICPLDACGADFPSPWNPAVGAVIFSQDHQDIRDRADWLVDDKCATYHSVDHVNHKYDYDSTVYSDDHLSHNLTNHLPFCGSDYTGDNDLYDNGYHSDYKVSEKNPNHVTHYGADYLNYHNQYHISHLTTHDATYCSTLNSVNYDSDHTSNNVTDNTPYNATEHAGNKSSEYVANNSAYYYTVG